jgi:hypothetical protein
VKKDVEKLEALNTARQAADALLAAVPKDGWAKALAAVNKQYGIAEGNKPADTFKVEPLSGLRRVSEQEVRMMIARTMHDPVQSVYVKRYAQQKELVDTFYSLLEPDKTVATNVPMIVEFKPQMAYYVVKSMSRSAVDPNTYQQSKDRVAFMQDYINGQSFGFEHFRADDIIKRMNFEWDEKTRNMPLRPDMLPEDDVI